jgi:hypothetical protein
LQSRIGNGSVIRSGSKIKDKIKEKEMATVTQLIETRQLEISDELEEFIRSSGDDWDLRDRQEFRKSEIDERIDGYIYSQYAEDEEMEEEDIELDTLLREEWAALPWDENKEIEILFEE